MALVQPWRVLSVHGGTVISHPLRSSGESGANLTPRLRQPASCLARRARCRRRGRSLRFRLVADARPRACQDEPELLLQGSREDAANGVTLPARHFVDRCTLGLAVRCRARRCHPAVSAPARSPVRGLRRPLAPAAFREPAIVDDGPSHAARGCCEQRIEPEQR
jgi:hypothetical protein